jgi:hypothetical protein
MSSTPRSDTGARYCRVACEPLLASASVAMLAPHSGLALPRKPLTIQPVTGEGHALIDGIDLTWQSNDTSAIPTHAKVAILNSFGDEAGFPVSNRRCAHAAQARFFRGILGPKRPRAPRDHRHPIRTIVLVATEMHYDAQAPQLAEGSSTHFSWNVSRDSRSG